MKWQGDKHFVFSWVSATPFHAGVRRKVPMGCPWDPTMCRQRTDVVERDMSESVHRAWMSCAD